MISSYNTSQTTISKPLFSEKWDLVQSSRALKSIAIFAQVETWRYFSGSLVFQLLPAETWNLQTIYKRLENVIKENKFIYAAYVFVRFLKRFAYTLKNV